MIIFGLIDGAPAANAACGAPRYQGSVFGDFQRLLGQSFFSGISRPVYWQPSLPLDSLHLTHYIF
jgi:hypothetical protein